MADTDLSPGPAAGLGDVLRTVGLELADLGRLAAELQAAFSPSGPREGPEGAALYRLQALDALTQTLDGVSDFLCALAPTVPSHWSCEATQAAGVVTLSDLARRLSCSDPGASPSSSGEAGELELFEG